MVVNAALAAAQSATYAARTGKTTVENNNMGALAGSDLGFWLGKTPDATTEEKAELAGKVAKGKGVVSARIVSTVGVGMLTAE